MILFPYQKMAGKDNNSWEWANEMRESSLKGLRSLFYLLIEVLHAGNKWRREQHIYYLFYFANFSNKTHYVLTFLSVLIVVSDAFIWNVYFPSYSHSGLRYCYSQLHYLIAWLTDWTSILEGESIWVRTDQFAAVDSALFLLEGHLI